MRTPATRALGPRAERTRAAILEAAETLFAERGFAATRLEDVAAGVGIRRASIVYHFRDKRELYDAVLAGLFGGLYERVSEALSSPAPLPERAEAAVSAWVDYVGERPALARLLLREVADAAPGRRPALREHTRPFAKLVLEQVVARPEADGLSPIDPVHLASAIAGSTVFFIAAMPALLPASQIEPLRPDQLEAHREQVLRILRRLAGTRGPRRSGASAKRPRQRASPGATKGARG